ncbi:relaxase/mobilization nuclease domain-containing protein [Bengtsoniella intestinalis]|uniref:relaxase/mobilization nuclease domain-containing protein n=1 Tax=Bengtsoniella intestinalis TaxID=3073143 RepID=UPI00391F61C6
MHHNRGVSLGQCIKDRTDYAKNPNKTNEGEHITTYMCDTDLVDSQFLLSKKLYEQKTGRTQKSNIIMYEVRQSFKPNEITPELANKIGYELAEKITKGNHAFIVCTHVDKAHIHTHIRWNSTSLDCKKKWRNFFNSTRAVRKISDLLCLKYGLSIVENPKEKSKHYGKWLDEEKPPTLSDKLRQTIDEVITNKPVNFDDFLKEMQRKDYEIRHGKHLAFKSKEQKKFIRLRSLGDEYQEDYIREVIDGKKTHTPPKKKTRRNDKKVNLLIDLQSAITAKKGVGYERWAKTFNIKQLAKTMNYLTENNLLNYEDLKVKSDAVNSAFSVLSKALKDTEKRLTLNSILQKNIIQFAKTKAVYEDYKKSGYSPKFKEENITEILLHQGAKNHFKELGLSKLPTMAELKNEYKELFAKKKKIHAEYNHIKTEQQEISNAKANVDHLLNIQNKEQEQTQKREKTSR